MKADIVHILDHSYAHIVLSEKNRPRVVTVHDLFPVITLRQSVGGWRERFRNYLLGRVVKGIKRADAWIVATEWLREQLAEWLGTSKNLHVIPYGVDDAFFEEPEEERSLKRAQWGIPESAFVVLHVGSVDKRKNIPAVIAVLEDLRTSGVDAWFLQVGGVLTPEQHTELAKRNVSDYVTQVGPVTEGDLRSAYHASDLLLFPSHYEGFGFPVLEAMASGLPVVTSGAGGLTEVAGDAAVVVGGREIEPYADAARSIASDSDFRDALIARGKKRATQFTWARAATDTAKAYENLV